MESTKQILSIRPIRAQKSNPYTLPFREGPGVGFSPREARLTLKMGVSGVSGFQVQDTHNASCFTNMTWIGLNLSGWNVTRLFHLRCFEL